MAEDRTSRAFRILAGYYGLLQSFHLLLLARAGVFLLQGRQLPFPAQPPLGGWTGDVLPCLLGMGLVDTFAIILGLVFVYKFFRGGTVWQIGLISLTAALSSGIVYLAGTLPSGAWEANPLGYGAVLILFSPVLPLFYFLLKHSAILMED